MNKNNIKNEYYIEFDILTRLNLLQGGYFWKAEYPSVFIPGKNLRYGKQKHPFIPNGIPDIIGVYKGRFCAFEVKRPEVWKYIAKHYNELKNMNFSPSKDKKRFATQIQFIENIKKNGGLAGFVCNYDQAERIIKKS